MIGNSVMGCGLRRKHFALPLEFGKYDMRTEEKEGEPAQDLEFEDQAVSEKPISKSVVAEKNNFL
jgi:hypothetical protein